MLVYNTWKTFNNQVLHFIELFEQYIENLKQNADLQLS